MNNTLSISNADVRLLRFAAVNVLQMFFDDLGAGHMLMRFNPDDISQVLPVAADDIRILDLKGKQQRLASIGFNLDEGFATIHIGDVRKLIERKQRVKFKEMGLFLASNLYKISDIEEPLQQAREGMLRPPRPAALPRRNFTPKVITA